jgi:hypothetical protein
MTNSRIVHMIGVIAASSALAAFGEAGARQAPGAVPRARPELDAPACRAVVAGTVTREVGNLMHGPPRDAGVPRIQVQLLDGEGARVTQTRTDQQGRYAFSKICQGTYTVCPGTPCPAGGPVPSRYAPASSEVRVSRVGLRGVDFRLLPPPPVRQPDPGRR